MLPNSVLFYSLEQSKSHDSRNRMINPVINGHFIRRQRSVNNMNVLNSKLPTLSHRFAYV